jgi:hypothetical protein
MTTHKLARLLTSLVLLASVAGLMVNAPAARAAFPGSTERAGAAGDVVQACPPDTKSWHALDGNHPFQVWLPKHASDSVAHKAEYVISQLDDQIWSKLTDAMGVVPVARPLPVCLTGANGVVRNASNLEQARDLCGPAPDWIDVDASDSDTVTRDYLAENFMYVLQDAVKSKCTGTWWWRHATAMWAESAAYPADIGRRAAFASHYLSGVQKPLNPASSDKNPSFREFGSYIFPLFLAHWGGGAPTIIGKIWDKTRDGESLLNAIDSVLIGGGAHVGWRDFALAAWNQAPYDYLRDWDGLKLGVRDYLPLDQRFKLDPASHNHVDSHLIPVNLPHLSAKYEEFTFPPNLGARTVTFINATHFADKKDETAQVQAILNINGTKSLLDLTGKPGAAFCLDQQSESLDSLVLIFSNGDVSHDIVTSSDDEHPQAMVVATDAGCKEWHGTVNSTLTGRNGDSVTDSVKFSFTAMGAFPSKFNDLVNAEYQLQAGSKVEWSVSGSTSGDGETCDYTGSQTLSPPLGPSPQGAGAFAMSWRMDYPLQYASTVTWESYSTWEPMVTANVHCESDFNGPSDSTETYHIDDLIYPGIDETSNVRVKGLKIQGQTSRTDSGRTTIWNWSVTSTG